MTHPTVPGPLRPAAAAPTGSNVGWPTSDSRKINVHQQFKHQDHPWGTEIASAVVDFGRPADVTAAAVITEACNYRANNKPHE
jgi:hypothetical protein